MPIELKPCPFCGGEADFATKRNDIFSLPLPWVVCRDCGAETSYYESPEEAAEAWNRRADDADALDYGFPMTDDVYGLSRQIGIEMVKARINEAPTIEAEPVRHGRWKKRRLDGWDMFVCSQCNGWAHSAAYQHKCICYCPNCGAKMDEGNDDV